VNAEMERFFPKKQEKEVISIRISTDLLATVDRKSASFDISRNEFINQCISFALEHMEDTD
jgi:metal-responsive CopG/Arc/MetJ family transcriptional regulator